MHSGSRYSTAPPIGALVGLLEAPPIAARLGPLEIETLAKLSVTENHYPADSIIIDQGATTRNVHLVASGWGCVYRDLANGKRQIIDFSMRCDFIGLRTANGYSYNTIASITPMTIFEIPLSSLEEAIKQAPRLSFILIELLSRQRALLIEHLTNIGCRSALVRTAYFMLELSDRVRACGIGDPDSFYCPLTQYQLADALGLTPIHLNRMLRELREEELMTFKSSRVEILDRDRLVAISDYDGEFLRMSVFDRN